MLKKKTVSVNKVMRHLISNFRTLDDKNDYSIPNTYIVSYIFCDIYIPML